MLSTELKQRLGIPDIDISPCTKHGGEADNKHCPDCSEERQIQADAQQREAERVAMQLHNAQVPARYKKPYDTTLIKPSQFDAIGTYINNAIHAADGANLILAGNYGAGKTHTAVAALTSYLKKTYDTQAITQKSARFMIADEVIDDLINKYKGQTSPVLNVDMLVIDDVGHGNNNAIEATAFYRLINHRSIRCLPTIITTNLEYKQLPAALGKAAADRLTENASIVVFNGPSLRRAKELIT